MSVPPSVAVRRLICGLGLIACGISCKPKQVEVPPAQPEATEPEPIPVKAPIIPRRPVKPGQEVPRPIVPEVRKAMLRFQLPTKNEGLFTNAGDRYFMFVDRSIKGVATEVWEGGQYGFVRDPKMANDGSIVYSRFHEGMDVKPVSRDAQGEPLDTVHTMADGVVIFVNANPRKSNYGNYVIVEHRTDDGPFYSLYAHLKNVAVQRGMSLQAGNILGIMGYTGTGINRRRAHCHVELNIVLSKRASIWEQSIPVAATITAPPATPKEEPTPVLIGQNMVGIDVSGWLKANRENPSLRISEFIRRSEPYFKIRTPSRGVELEIAKRYPWLRVPGPIGQSWEIAISASSIPLSVTPIAEPTEFTTVTWVKPFVGNHAWKSREVLTGSGTTASLSRHGQEYMKLLLAE